MLFNFPVVLRIDPDTVLLKIRVKYLTFIFSVCLLSGIKRQDFSARVTI